MVVLATAIVIGAVSYARGAISTAPAGQKKWYWQNPLPQGNAIYGVDSPGSGEVWAIGGPGVILHSSDDGTVWEPQDSGSTGVLRAVDFADVERGWVVGDSTIRATADGGSTWATQTATLAITARGVSMATTQTGWIVGSTGAIRKSSNGGSTPWSTVVSPTTQNLYGIDAVDSTHAWAVGGAGAVVSTSNGTTWTVQSTPTTQTLNAVSFVDTQTGFAVGAAGTFLKTLDGGSTWTSATVQYLGPTGLTVAQTGALTGVSFRSATTGWIVGASGRILWTTNGGTTWTDQSSGSLGLNGVAAGSGSKAYAVGTSGTMLRTIDDGATWNNPQQGTTLQLNGSTWTSATKQIAVGASGLVMSTDDAGDTWSIRTAGSAGLNAVDFADQNIGWAVGAAGTVRSTSDGGDTWTKRASATVQALNAVTSVSTSTVIAVGAAGTVVKSTDGGLTWATRPSGTTRALYDVFFVNPTTGWAVGQAGTIRKTVDGGDSWSAAASSGASITIYSVHFADALNGWLVGSSGAVRRTTNGGVSWTSQTPLGTTYTLYSVEMASASHGWAVGGAPAVGSTPAKSACLHTTDGGVTWLTQNAGFNGYLRSVSVVDTASAGVAGVGGSTRQTRDGGDSWATSSFSTVANLTDLAFVDSDTGYAVGSGGTVARTRNGGLSWGSLVSGTTSALQGVDFPAPGAGWVVGAAGTIRKTADGVSWSPQVSGVTSTLQGVDFADTSTGFAVGVSGVIRATADGGSTWTAQAANVPTSTTLYGVSAVDTRTAFAWGSAGTVLRTADGGSSWTTQTISASALYAGTFVSAQTGWVAGAGGVLFKTTDGGVTWIPQASGVTAAIYGIGFLGSMHGYLVGGAGTTNSSFVRETTDGATWTPHVPGTVNILRAVAFTDADHGWTVGDSGTILRTTDNTPPTTLLATDPALPDGTNGWFVAAPSVSLTSDEPGITYFNWLSSGGPWSTFSAPVVSPADGQRTVYYYSVDPGGNKEALKSRSFKIDTAPPSTPATPTATPLSPTSIMLAWGASADFTSGVDHYEVRSLGSLVGTSPVNSMTLSSLATETVYPYTVTAVDVAGNASGESDAVQVSTLAQAARPPVAVYARTIPGMGAFVNWGETTGTVAPVSYRISRSVGGAPFSAIATLAGEASRSYTDTGAPVWASLRYAVSVIDARGPGPMSGVSSSAATTGTILSPPGGVTAKNTASVLVTWTPLPQSGITGYHVYRSTTSTSTGTTLTVSPVPTPSYHDTSTAGYTEYWYRVAGVDASGATGSRSSPAHIRTVAASSTTAAPHVAYAQDTSMCALCHSAHAATAPLLLRGTTTDEAPLCFSCHDGTSASDVMGEYTAANKTSRHAVSVGSATGTLRCGGCHSVHSAEQTGTARGLLLAGGKTTSGNAYCYECHGASAGSSPRGDLRGFEGSAHATAVPEPQTGTKVVCLSCHVAHSSAEASLYPYSDDDRCLGCHSAGSLSGTKTDIAAKLSGTGPDTRHNLLSADTSSTGSRLGCGNCHEPHTSSATTPCVDPDRPTVTGGMLATDALCLRCHDGALPASVDTSGWAPAPLAESGATTTTDMRAGWTASSHGASSSVVPQLRADMGYAKGDVLTCRSCHDAHGSTNRFALRESVSAKSGAQTVDGLLVVPLPGGGADLRFFCASCHEVGPTTHPDAASGGADLSVWPLDCTSSGCHTHAGTGL